MQIRYGSATYVRTRYLNETLFIVRITLQQTQVAIGTFYSGFKVQGLR